MLEQLARSHAQLMPALIGGGMAAAATALGTLPVLLSQKCSQRSINGGFASVALVFCFWS